MVERQARSKVQILAQARIFLTKSKTLISQGTNYKFVFTYQFDLKIFVKCIIIRDAEMNMDIPDAA